MANWSRDKKFPSTEGWQIEDLTGCSITFLTKKTFKSFKKNNMTNFTHSFRLAFIKFKQKGWRNTFAILSLSLGSLLILTILIGLSGLLPFAQKALQDPLYGRYLARQGEVYGSQNLPTLNDAKKELEGYGYKQILENKDFKFKINLKNANLPKQKIYSGMVPNQNIEVDGDGFFPIIRDSSFTKDLVESNYNFETKNENTIPVLISVNNLIESNDYQDRIPSGKELAGQIEKATNTLKNKYLGKEFDLTLQKNSSVSGDLLMKIQNGENSPSKIDQYKDELTKNQTDLGVKIKIVGFTNYLNGVFESSNIVFPAWAETVLVQNVQSKANTITDFYKNLASPFSYNYGYERSDSVENKNNETTQTLSENRYLIEFNSKEDRTKFLNQKYGQGGNEFLGDSYSPNTLDSSLVIFESVITTARNIGLGVGIFLLIIGCLFSISLISKEISDSQKEIGVYRALGATKWQVSRIYFSYGFILTSVAFLISLILAYMVNLAVSYFVNDYIYAGLITASFKLFVQKPNFVLVGFPILEILAFFVLLVALSLFFSLLPIRRISKIDPIKVLKD